MGRSVSEMEMSSSLTLSSLWSDLHPHGPRWHPNSRRQDGGVYEGVCKNYHMHSFSVQLAKIQPDSLTLFVRLRNILYIYIYIKMVGYGMGGYVYSKQLYFYERKGA